MDNKKIVSVAVLAVLALAFAGYGYADYTASTYNADNKVVVNYITVEPKSWDAIVALEDIALDTYTFNAEDNNVLYAFADQEYAEAALEDELVPIGNKYILTITDGTTVECDSFTLGIDVLGTVVDGDNFILYIGVGDNTPVKFTEYTPVEVEAGDVEIQLYLFVDGYDEEIQFPTTQGWDTIKGTLTAPPAEPILSGMEDKEDDPNTTGSDEVETGAVFIFTVTGTTA